MEPCSELHRWSNDKRYGLSSLRHESSCERARRLCRLCERSTWHPLTLFPLTIVRMYFITNSVTNRELPHGVGWIGYSVCGWSVLLPQLSAPGLVHAAVVFHGSTIIYSSIPSHSYVSLVGETRQS